jgi:hypothetical protein
MPGGIARRGTAVDVGGEEAVVAHGALRAGARFHLEDGGKRDHLAQARPHLESADIVGACAEWGIGLHPHRIGAPEPVEVVDVE